MVGEVTGPVSKTLDAAGASIAITGIYEAEIRFTFDGRTFDVLGDFVVADTVSWLAFCR